jgi:hypothetical protein
MLKGNGKEERHQKTERPFSSGFHGTEAGKPETKG